MVEWVGAMISLVNLLETKYLFQRKPAVLK